MKPACPIENCPVVPLIRLSPTAKMTLMPAQRLEARVPAMKKKGRIQVGADGDINIFDPETIHDRSTYEKGKAASEGVRYLLVNGTLVIQDGKLVDAIAPGKAIRAPLQH